MGFYYGIERLKASSADLAPVITPHEYTTCLYRAMLTVFGRTLRESDTCHPDPRRLEAPVPRAFLQALLRRVRCCPGDATAHRRLGTALRCAGDPRAGVRHLETALKLLLGEAASGGSLHDTLRIQLEIALLLPMLRPISARSGRRELVRRLITEVLRR